MRIVLPVLLLSTASHAEPLASATGVWLEHNYDSAFAPRIAVGPLWFADDGCVTRFAHATIVTGAADRESLGECLREEGIASSYPLRGNHYVVVTPHGEAIEVVARRGHIQAIGPVGGGAIATFDRLGVAAAFQPATATRYAIDRSELGTAEALYKVCHDAAGTITSHHAVRRSGDPSFDRDAERYVAKLASVEPLAPGGTNLAACDLLVLRYPQLDLDPSSLAPDPDPTTWIQITGEDLHEHRIAGDRVITPDDVTKTEIFRAGKTNIVGTFHVCIDAEGIPTVAMLKSTGFADYDKKLATGMRAWRFEPFERVACAQVSVVYTQR